MLLRWVPLFIGGRVHGGCRGVVGSVKQVYGGHPIVLLIIWCPMGYACQNSGHIFFAENTSRNY